MARWQVTVTGKGVRKAAVEKLANSLKSEFGEGVTVSVTDATIPESRADRFNHVQSLAGDAKSEVENLMSELQDWYDNMPENLQSGDKGSQLEETIQELEEVHDKLEEVEGQEINFPSMMG